jgi:hypothetical protein
LSGQNSKTRYIEYIEYIQYIEYETESWPIWSWKA